MTKTKKEAIKPSHEDWKKEIFQTFKDEINTCIAKISPQAYEKAMAELDIPSVTVKNIHEPLDKLILLFAEALENIIGDALENEVAPHVNALAHKAKQEGATDICREIMDSYEFSDEMRKHLCSCVTEQLKSGLPKPVVNKALTVVKRIFAVKLYHKFIELYEAEPQKVVTRAIDEAINNALEQALETLNTDFETPYDEKMSSACFVFWQSFLPAITASIRQVSTEYDIIKVYNLEYRIALDTFIRRKG